MVPSKDMAFDIEYTGDEGQVFKWRWETNFEGYKSSSQLLSQHLILPLLTLSHMSLSNDDDEDAKDIEKAVTFPTVHGGTVIYTERFIRHRQWIKHVGLLGEHCPFT